MSQEPDGGGAGQSYDDPMAQLGSAPADYYGADDLHGPGGPRDDLQTIAELRIDVDALTEAMETLVGVVERLQSGGGGAGGGGGGGDATPSRWAWRYADEQNSAKLWLELREFVDWLNGRYSLDSERQVPSCWFRHPVAVEELTALMASWQAVYHGPDTARDDLLAWHAHWLWGCLDRLPDRAGWTRCKGGRHIERTSMIQATDDSFDDFVRAQPQGPGAFSAEGS